MTVDFQESLLDFMDEQPTEARPGSLGTVRRVPLSRGAWVDVRPGWLTGAADLFARLVEQVPWRAEKRQMYDRVVDVPRLLCFYGEDEVLPDPALEACRSALSAHYGPELGEPFVTAGLCLTGTGGTAWPGTGTRPGAAAARTPWWRSCRWGRRGH